MDPLEIGNEKAFDVFERDLIDAAVAEGGLSFSSSSVTVAPPQAACEGAGGHREGDCRDGVASQRPVGGVAGGVACANPMLDELSVR